MNREQVKQSTVKNYWEDKSPGLKHSEHDTGSEDFFTDVEKERYSDQFKYKYLPQVAKFNSFKGKDVLEIGVGLGTDILQYAKHGANVHGIDLTENAVKLTSDRFKQNKLNGVFKTASFSKIPFKDSTFDMVYSFGVLHHSEETQEGINEVFRVLKPGGNIIIMLYHKGFKYYIRKLFLYGVLKGEFLKYSSQDIINRHSEDFGSCPMTKAYNRNEASKMFCNYDNIKFSVYRLDDNFRIFGKDISLSMFIFPKRIYRYLENKFGWNLIIKANKPEK
jgi:ubiquinone/menaquinone biosynthesis C-methylase UbiE